MTLEAKISHFIEREGLPKPDARLVVGLSGGADSVALLSALTALGYDCTAVHCHFGLRDAEEADRDLAHAEAVARQLGAGFRSVRFATRQYMAEHGVSAEMACRELRYDFFEQVRAAVGAEATAVAHHRDDNIETLFLNLLRGAGLHGVRAMLPRSGNVIRPMLECRRSEILEYLQQRGLTYVTDSTNAKNDFQRNRLRNVVLPTLYANFPGAADALTCSLANLRGNEALYNSLLPRAASLDEVKRSAAPLTLLHELLSPLGFNAAQCADVLAAQSGSVFTSAQGVKLCVEYGEMRILPADNADGAPQLAHRRLSPAEFKPQSGHLYLDAEAAEGNPTWELRRWTEGDRMRPFGMTAGSRLLSDVFATARIPAAERRRQWVLTRNGVILWAVGVRASAHFPVTENTNEIIDIYEKN
jgi:tRNA(Ile)-lysidine synthase